MISKVVKLADDLRQDIRYGFRSLAGSPGFTAVALISLSLGICIATCAFSEMNGMALRSVPGVRDPQELVAVQAPISYPAYERFREQGDLFSSTLAYVAPVPFSVSLNTGTERFWGHLITSSYFSTLGMQPALGSFFQANQAQAVVISHRFWTDHFGADRSVIGQTLRINGHSVNVIGVAPDDFLGASPMLFPADLWLPVSVGAHIAPELANNALERRDRTMFFMTGRLKRGLTLAQAEAELDAVARQFDQESGATAIELKNRRVLLVEGGKLFPLRKQDVPFFTSFFTIVASLIMLIACANVANMMLARGAGRRREIAVRLALGAGRARLLRQLLTESMIVALAAGALGFLGSTWLMSLLAQVRLPFPMPIAFDFRPDVRVFLITLAITFFTGIVFGLAPALQATRTNLTPALKEGGDLALRGHRRLSLRNLMMVTQVGGSLTLLVVLGLLSLGILRTLAVRTGFDARNLYLISLDPIRDGHSREQATAFLERVLDRVKTLPSVAAASLTETVPVSLPSGVVTISTPASRDPRIVSGTIKHVVGKDYFDTTGIPILLGRGFRKEDEADGSTAVILSQETARRLWPGEEAIGRRIEVSIGQGDPPKILPGAYDRRAGSLNDARKILEVVGVAADVAEGLIVGKPRPAIYLPLRPADYGQPSVQGVTLMVRGLPGVDVLSAVRREVSAIDDKITPFNARSMDDQIAQLTGVLSMAAWTYGVVGIFGLILAAVGLAGVTAYAVAQRRREIGIRMALGARATDVLGLVMREGMILIGIGTIIGMTGAWIGSRLLSAMNASVGTVTSTNTSDPAILIGAPLFLATLALAACYLPARKSMRIDPVTALRQE